MAYTYWQWEDGEGKTYWSIKNELGVCVNQIINNGNDTYTSAEESDFPLSSEEVDVEDYEGILDDVSRVGGRPHINPR